MISEGVVFNIILGSACNWKCPYCIQEKGVGCNKKYDASEFVDKLKDFITNNNIDSIKRFSYWGGEPLLYLSQLKTLVKGFSELKTFKPHRTITNGSLMNEDFISFANRYHMLINLSYHNGQLDYDHWKKCLYIENLNVTSLIHHKRLNWDEFYKKWLWLQDEFGRCVNWFVYPMLSVDGVGGEYSLTCHDVDVYLQNLYRYLDKLDIVFFQKAISVLFFAFKMGNINKNYVNFCFNEDNYSIDLHGNRYLCHHNFTQKARVGNIFCKSIKIISETGTAVLNRSLSPICKDCNVFRYCRGGCYRYNGQDVYCYYRKKMFEFLLHVKNNYSDCFADEYLSNIE